MSCPLEGILLFFGGGGGGRAGDREIDTDNNPLKIKWITFLK